MSEEQYNSDVQGNKPSRPLRPLISSLGTADGRYHSQLLCKPRTAGLNRRPSPRRPPPPSKRGLSAACPFPAWTLPQIAPRALTNDRQGIGGGPYPSTLAFTDLWDPSARHHPAVCATPDRCHSQHACARRRIFPRASSAVQLAGGGETFAAPAIALMRSAPSPGKRLTPAA
jgi:hypothetical protein